MFGSQLKQVSSITTPPRGPISSAIGEPAHPGREYRRRTPPGRFREIRRWQIHADSGSLTGADRLRGAGQVHADAQAFDLCLERQATQIVQLHRHQARGELHDVGFQAQALERVGRFQTEQATADHHAAPGIGRRRSNRIEVFEGAVDQARIAFSAFNRRHERVGAGGQTSLS
jgi:hypothetical protein